MPKRRRERHSDDDYEHLARKVRKLKRKMKHVHRRRRSRSRNSSSDDSRRLPYDPPERRSIAIVDDDNEENVTYSPAHSSWYNFSEPEEEPIIQYVTAEIHPPPAMEPHRPRSVVAAEPPGTAAAAPPGTAAAAPPDSAVAAPLVASAAAVGAPASRAAIQTAGASLSTDSIAPHAPTLSSETIASGAQSQKLPTDNSASNEIQVVELDSDLMEILGEDPTCTKEYGPDIQKDLAIRLNHIATSGLTKDNRKDLKDNYLIPGNCKLIKAPSLNPEIRASLMESQAKRDKGIENKQNMTSCALSSISTAITMLLLSENKNPELLKLLMDTARILGDIQHSDTILRRFFVLSTVKKDLKDQLEKTKIDEMLFGSNLSETLKSAKTISKSGADIRSASTAKASVQATTKTPGRPLNYRAPPARGRPAAAGSARGARPPPPPPPAPAPRRMTTRPTQYSASRMSSRHQRHQR